MKVQFPTVGPIIGYTTDAHTRIWLRGEFHKTPDGFRRCFSAVRIKPLGAAKFGPPFYTKAVPHFDMTAVSVFTGLAAETDYEYQAGWFFAETGMDSLEKLDPDVDVDWKLAATGQFRTGTADDAKERNYVLGSCRYLLRLFGGYLFDERGDKTFKSILAQIQGGARIDGLMMVGDQIYADDLNFLLPTTTIDEFLERYRAVFAQPFLRKLMAQTPTYMILDDHEIEDNWPEKADEEDRVTLYPAAIHAYQIYQASHSPIFQIGTDGGIDGTPNRLWYNFQDGCCDWFVMDSRTERIWDKLRANRRMIKQQQMDALLAWLEDGSGRVKMIVTSVPFFPDLEDESDDKWEGYPAQRTEILNFILKKKIRKVVFLSGDVHCSFSSELTSPDDPKFKVLSVVCSSFFWPYPHMSESDFVLKGKLRGTGGKTFNVGNTSEIFGTDNFGRLKVSPDAIDISFFERKGDPLGKTVTRKLLA